MDRKRDIDAAAHRPERRRSNSSIFSLIFELLLGVLGHENILVSTGTDGIPASVQNPAVEPPSPLRLCIIIPEEKLSIAPARHPG
jgi:hypothetical protein